VAMDFFQHQERARKQTGRLVILYGLAVVGIIALVYVAVTMLVFFAGSRHDPTAEPDFWAPDLLLWIGGGTIVLVGVASLAKIAELAAGGSVVAESLGGRPLNAGTRDETERKVLNVVEEMSIASGVPVPAVYLLDGESRINAFAAGHKPEHAVVGITRGAAETLSRDELQGVVAHEFSHILNGDMRLNIRLIGILHGILVIGLLGGMLARAAFYGGGGSSRRGARSAVTSATPRSSTCGTAPSPTSRSAPGWTSSRTGAPWRPSTGTRTATSTSGCTTAPGHGCA